MLYFSNERIKNFLESFFEKPKEDQSLEIQSLLFQGEKNLGKFTLAYNFAKTILCLKEKKVWGGCGNCISCQLIDKNIHPDLKIINTPLDTISIDEIRGNEEKNIEGIIQFLSFYPQIADLRIAIINEAEKMNAEAQNAFLKTLEEPPPKSLIILITSQPEKLYKTLISRLLILKFHRSPKDKLIKYLKKEYLIDENQAFKIVKESNGKIGLAINLLDKSFVKEREDYWRDFLTLMKSDFSSHSVYLENLLKKIKEKKEEKEGKETEEIRKILSIWLEKLEKEVKKENNDLSISQEKKIKITKELLNAYEIISYSNVNIQLLLENTFLLV
ncbi:MAG: ATP-binding protein [Minisyncoccia bacterium]